MTPHHQITSTFLSLSNHIIFTSHFILLFLKLCENKAWEALAGTEGVVIFTQKYKLCTVAPYNWFTRVLLYIIILTVESTQGAKRLSCNLCGDGAFQNNRIVHVVSDISPTAVLWHNVDPNSGRPFPSLDYASRPGSTISASQVFQSSSSARLGCCRV